MTKKGSNIRLFLGCLKKGMVETHFLQSAKWKEDILLGQNNLIETLFQGKPYVGKAVEGVEITQQQLNNLSNEVKNALQTYCPELQADNVELFLFPEALFK